VGEWLNENSISIAFSTERYSGMNRGDLADLTAFVSVADRLSFRAAASRLGVTPSALSHSMRQLEERLGMRLLHRTTRSVSVTDAGSRLLERLRPAISEIAGAIEDLNQERQRPVGRLRIYAIQLAAAAVIAPIWGRFLSTYPEVQLELAVGLAPIDIVAKGFDAGIGPRDRAPADMIAVRVMGPMKIVVVGAPTYFARRRSPRSPSQLCAIPSGGRRRRTRVAFRADRQIAPRWGGWAGDRQRCGSGCSRGGRRAWHRIYTRSSGRAVPALGPACPRTGRLDAIVRGNVSLLSREPTSPGYVARPHRHDPHDPRLGAGQAFPPNPFTKDGTD
jgi:DNA-binding transcriptional LysR family regulator